MLSFVLLHYHMAITFNHTQKIIKPTRKTNVLQNNLWTLFPLKTVKAKNYSVAKIDRMENTFWPPFVTKTEDFWYIVSQTWFKLKKIPDQTHSVKHRLNNRTMDSAWWNVGYYLNTSKWISINSWWYWVHYQLGWINVSQFEFFKFHHF